MALAHPIHPNSIFALELRESMEKGAYLQKLEIAKGMFADGFPMEVICKYTGVSKEDMNNLLKQ